MLLIQKISPKGLLKRIIFAGSVFPALFKRLKRRGEQNGCINAMAERRDLFFFLLLIVTTQKQLTFEF